MKKSLTCFLVLALVFTGFITSNAKINEPDIAEILKLYADSINQKNEDEYLSLFHPEYYKDSKDALDFYAKSISEAGFSETEFMEVFDEDLPHLIRQGIDKDDVPIMLDQLRYVIEE